MGDGNVHSDTLGMDGSKVGILEQGDKVCLRGLLKSHNSRRLETKIGLVVYHPTTISHPRPPKRSRNERPTLSDFTDEPLEGQLANEKLGALLVATDFTEGDGSRAEAVRLLHAACRRRRLAGLLGGELLARGFATSRFAGGLLQYMYVRERVEDREG